MIEQIARDLSREPDQRAFSRRNLRMKQFMPFMRRKRISANKLVAQILGGINDLINNIKKIKGKIKFGIRSKPSKTAGRGNVLAHQIDSQFYERCRKTRIDNFTERLPALQSDLAQSPKDPYIFDFQVGRRSPRAGAGNRPVEGLPASCWSWAKGLPLSDSSFTNIWRARDFYIDLLFYHLRLHCYTLPSNSKPDCSNRNTPAAQFHLTALDEQVK